MLYCYKCGKECILEWEGTYNNRTGEKTMRQICPDECKHGDHKYADKLPTLWESFTGKDRCLRCGKRYKGEMFYA